MALARRDNQAAPLSHPLAAFAVDTAALLTKNLADQE
jgi:hypothetical protein